MEHWQADYDKGLEYPPLPIEELEECECGKFVKKEKRHVCEGCGEGLGCEDCMYWDKNYMDWFCGPECVRELERKLAKKRPDFT